MKRRNFLATTAATVPAIVFGQTMDIPQARTDKGFVVKADKSRFGESTLISGATSPNDIKVSSKDTGGNLTVFEYVGKVKGGPPLHFHHNQDEIFFVVEGEYIFKVGEEMYELTKGDTIFLPRKVPHTFAQKSERGRMYFMFQPSGKMEDFFRKLAAIVGEPTPEQGAKLFVDHEMKVVGPPLTV